jgi:hypothetical protein
MNDRCLCDIVGDKMKQEGGRCCPPLPASEREFHEGRRCFNMTTTGCSSRSRCLHEMSRDGESSLMQLRASALLPSRGFAMHVGDGQFSDVERAPRRTVDAPDSCSECEPIPPTSVKDALAGPVPSTSPLLPTHSPAQFTRPALAQHVWSHRSRTSSVSSHLRSILAFPPLG